MLNDVISCGLAGEEIRFLVLIPMDRPVRLESVREEMMREIDGEEVLDYITRQRNDSDTIRYHGQVHEYERKLEKLKLNQEKKLFNISLIILI